MADTMSVLSESTSLRGRVAGEGDLEIRGRVEGEIDLSGELVVAETAVVRANVRGTRVVVRGALLGDIAAAESITLSESARVVGNLTAPRIAIALGAQIRGELDMGIPGLAKPAAKVAAAPAKAPATATRAAAPAARVTPVAAAAPAARRAPMPPPRAAVAPRPAPAPMAVVAAEPVDVDGVESADEASGEPPNPVVPSIKKGARAPAAKKKG